MNGIIDSNQKIVANGLVLNLDAAQRRSYPSTGTTWNDLSGNNRNGTLINGPTFNSANGGSISFDGVNDYVNTNYNAGTFSQFTIHAWIFKTNTTKAFILNTAGTATPPAFLFGFGIELYEDVAYFDVTSGSTDGYAEFPFTGNGWNCWSLVYDGTQTGNSNKVKVYLNSVLQSLTFTGTIASSIPSSDVFYLSRRPWVVEYSLCRIANVNMYNRALSAAEVGQNFNALKSRFGL
jgi:hypothetical protein